MDLYKLMEKRRSTRKFSNRKVPKYKIEKILKAGQMAPSGADQKPYIYIIIEDTDLKKKIKIYSESIDKKHYSTAPQWFKKWMKEKNISLEKDFLIDASFLVVAAGDTKNPYWLESAWLSIAYVILAAENEGLSTLTYTPADMNFLKDLLNFPKRLKPVVILPVGYAKTKNQ
ncbi:MAG: nitroreductase family protein [Thermoplasmatales archaeon]|nr:MAG: nitroreductase family protein [Thermoplasmatales archaeon]